MILVNVYFAETNRTYDFRVEAGAPVGQVVNDMVNLIALQDHLLLNREQSAYILCRRASREIFGTEATLRSYDVHSGDELMLI